MATTVEATSVLNSDTFRARVNIFVVKQADIAMDEVATTPGHTERAAFANKVFVSDYDLTQYTSAVLTNSTILTNLNTTDGDNGIIDSDLEFTVNSFYNSFAGIATT